MTAKEQAENRKKWVEALRSGKYKQTSDSLRNREGDGYAFCCLGVACDLYNPNLWEQENPRGASTYLENTCSLPTAVMNWLGLKEAEGQWDEEDPMKVRSLSIYNDDGATFDEIADLIEDPPPGLLQ